MNGKSFYLAGLALLLAAGLNACGGQTDDTPRLTPEERMAMAPDAELGKKLFLQCAVCHERTEGMPHRVGPNLWGIYGAHTAHHEDFTYSAAMKRTDFIWDDDHLNSYIENPQAFVPGNRMAFAGVLEEADRRDIIAYLKTLQ